MPRVAPTLYDFVGLDDGEYLKVAEAVFRIFDRQDWLRVNRARARIKVLVDKIGIDELRKLVEEELQGDWVAERDFDVERPAVSTTTRRARARPRRSATPRPTATAREFERFRASQRQRRSARRASRPSQVKVTARRPDARAVPRRSAEIMRDYSGGYARTTVQQNLVLRWVRDEAVYEVWQALARAGLGDAGADEITDVVSLPRHRLLQARHHRARWASTRPSRSASTQMEITDPLTRRIHIKMSGCPNGCSQHHIANIGFYGASIKVGEHTIPAYVAHIGGNYEGGEVVYGTRLKVRLPAKRVPEAVERWIRFYEADRAGRRGVQRLRRAASATKALRGRRSRTSRCRSSSASRR